MSPISWSEGADTIRKSCRQGAGQGGDQLDRSLQDAIDDTKTTFNDTWAAMDDTDLGSDDTESRATTRAFGGVFSVDGAIPRPVGVQPGVGSALRR